MPLVMLNTGIIVPSSTPPPSGHNWNPGWYANTVSFGNAGQSARLAEIAEVRAGPSVVLGWQGMFYPAEFESTLGTYTFANLKACYNAITGYVSGTGTGAVYSSPRRLWIQLFTERAQATVHPSDLVPAYIFASPGTYGTGPDGNGGWYTQTGGLPSMAEDNAATLARMQAMRAAIAACVFDDGYTPANSPWVEVFWPFGETAQYNPSDSSSVNIAMFEAIIANAASLFPTTNVAIPNNFMQSTGDANTIGAYLAAQKVCASGPDIFSGSPTEGQAYYVANNVALIVPYIGCIESTEMGDISYSPMSALLTQANLYDATHCAVDMVTWTPGGHSDSNWVGTATGLTQWLTAPATFGGVLYFMTQNSLANSSKPSGYA